MSSSNIGLARKRRLKSRFVAHDNEINRWLGVFVISFLTLLVFLPWLSNRLGAPDWLLKILVLGIVVTALPAMFAGHHYLSLRIGAKYNLLCANCGRPLRKFSFRSNTDDRKDGEVARRCPHCHLDILESTGRKSR